MPNILYAEDDRDVRELYSFVLRDSGYRVMEAVNGAQAVQIVRDEDVDLVILDVRMPMMTGYAAARMMGKEYPELPVMFLSVRGLLHEVERAFDCGSTVVDYLVKPVSPNQLVRRVDQVLQVVRSYGSEMVRQESLARTELAYIWLRP